MAKLFDTGGQFPPQSDIERIAKYQRFRMIFDGKQAEVYDRAAKILKDTPFAPQLETLYIAVNVADVLLTKPADLLVAEPPSYESGKPDASPEQKALNRIVEENDVNQLVHEITIGAGIRGESWIKPYYRVRTDFSEVEELGLPLPTVKAEPILEAVDASIVYPELVSGSRKRFKAVNIAWVEWVATRNNEIPFLNVERHLPGYIIYERYRLHEYGVDSTYDVPVSTYTIGERVATGKDSDIEVTGVPRILVEHVPYKTVDDDWQGIGGIEKIESVLAAINDRLVQIDYILFKHSDPTAYGPEIDSDADGGVRFGGKYIPLDKGDATPGYMTWESQLEGAFKELDLLLGLVYQMSETPQWLFGTTLAEDKGGSGTSHTDGAAIKARFMPILSKVKRIRVHVDKAIRTALWTAMELEVFANENVAGFENYTPVYPSITWRDGIPRDEKTEAEVMQIRTGNRATIDVQSAIKRLDGVDDEKATEISKRIDKDAEKDGFADPSAFNTGGEGGDE